MFHTCLQAQLHSVALTWLADEWNRGTLRRLLFAPAAGMVLTAGGSFTKAWVSILAPRTGVPG